MTRICHLGIGIVLASIRSCSGRLSNDTQIPESLMSVTL